MDLKNYVKNESGNNLTIVKSHIRRLNNDYNTISSNDVFCLPQISNVLIAILFFFSIPWFFLYKVTQQNFYLLLPIILLISIIYKILTWIEVLK